MMNDFLYVYFGVRGDTKILLRGSQAGFLESCTQFYCRHGKPCWLGYILHRQM